MGHDGIGDTDEFRAPVPEPGIDMPRVRPVAVEVDIAALSHPGKVRSNNEDHYLVARAGRFLQTWMTNLPEGLVAERFEEIIYGMAVADGLGGMPAGEVASQRALAVLVDLVLSTPDWNFGLAESDVERALMRAADRLRTVNAALVEHGRSDPSREGMGTTLTLTWSLGSTLFLAHVGDSRAYLLRRGVLRQLTRDHTRAQELADIGAIASENVATHRLRNVLTQIIGMWENGIEPQVERLGLEDGDRLLVCTDGLTEMVDGPIIAGELDPARNPTADEACRSLLKQALEWGGKDNVTIVVAGYQIGAGS